MDASIGPTVRLDAPLTPAEQEILAAIQLRLEIRQAVEEALRRSGQPTENDPLLLQRIVRRVVERLAQI